jgi:hypothetical protein
MLPHLYFYDITFLLFCKDTEQALKKTNIVASKTGK